MTARRTPTDGARTTPVTRNDMCDNGLLDVLRSEVWPLLSDCSVVTRTERERILGYDPETGVSGHDGP